MKKSNLKTTTVFTPPNGGIGVTRVSKTMPAEGGKPYDSTEWQIKGSTAQGEGTANSRYARSVPGEGGAQPIGDAQPLRTNSPMKDEISSIGPGVLTKSTPARKRRA